MFYIREASEADLEAVADLFDLYRQFYDQVSNPALAAQFIRERFNRRESVILIAVDEGDEPVGFCQLYPSFCSVEAKPVYLLYDLFVHPGARRQGVARLLLVAAEERARADGKTRMDLTTAKTNQSAQALYESLGWVRDQVFFTYNRAVK